MGRYRAIERRVLGLGFAALMAIAPGTASATADGPDHFRVRGVAPGHSLAMRAEPSATATRVGAIPAEATCVRNLGCRGGLTLEEFTTLSEDAQRRRAAENPRWCRVEFQGREGWVAGGYLAEAACAAPQPGRPSP